MAKGTNKLPKVIFQPSGRRGYVNDGETIKQASQELGVGIEGICGEKATCGKCKVRIEEGVFAKYKVESRMDNLSPPNKAEKKQLTSQQQRDGYRLACQARIHGDVSVFVPEE
ncbi:MAG: 2Fe-2S iron-sulfur cluster binding domain-containing protein, partial [Dehalococcoidia bacterium]